MHTNRILSRTMLTLVVGVASAAWAGPPSPATSVTTQTSVPLAQDGCLDHTVKELGMSAKKVEGAARRWEIAPRFLHGALAKDPGAAFGVELEKTDKAALVHVRASWPGAPKDKDVQLELEERLRVMTAKIAQMCGVVRPEVVCTTTPARGAATLCTPPPPGP